MLGFLFDKLGAACHGPLGALPAAPHLALQRRLQVVMIVWTN